jgi:hypothetical protein
MNDKVSDNCEIPELLWWAKGHEALQKNRQTGDFDTWPDLSKVRGNPYLSERKVHMQAFGASFLRADIETMIPASQALPAAVPTAAKGGRPKADWWEDLWIEICRQLYRGELIPKTQADIERAMHQWISWHSHSAGDTTVRDRATKLWRVIKVEK